jgi:hypothetical protein
MHFKTTTTVALASIIAHVYGHGLVTGIQGANGVNMPGLGNIDGTPRDCSTAGCGAENDVPVFATGGNPLGKSAKGGNINAADEVSTFMGTGAGAAGAGNNAAASPAASSAASPVASPVASPAAGNQAGAANQAAGKKGKKGAKKGAKNNGAANAQKGNNQGTATNGEDPTGVNDPNLQPETAAPINGAAPPGAVAGGQDANAQIIDSRAAQQAQGALAQGTKTPPGTTENAVAGTAGQGAKSGLPTADQNGAINLQFHQVNADGAGPYTATIDPSSGGTQEGAFQAAQMTTNVPGQNGNDAQNAATDFNVQVQMPAGMQCTGTIAGQKNVCVVRIQNPKFGGSAVFQQAGAAGGNAGGAAGAADAAAQATPAAAGGAAASSPTPASNAASGAQAQGQQQQQQQGQQNKKNKQAKNKGAANAKANQNQNQQQGTATNAEDPTGVNDPGLQPETAAPINGAPPVGAVAGGQDANAQIIDSRRVARRFVA